MVRAECPVGSPSPCRLTCSALALLEASSSAVAEMAPGHPGSYPSGLATLAQGKKAFSQQSCGTGGGSSTRDLFWFWIHLCGQGWGGQVSAHWPVLGLSPTYKARGWAQSGPPNRWVGQKVLFVCFDNILQETLNKLFGRLDAWTEIEMRGWFLKRKSG